LLFHARSVLCEGMARILVVDDTAQSLALIELYLRGTEFDVVAVSDGHAAIEASLQQSFDVILLDVAMPGIDGFEVCRRLKNDPRTAFVPVLFLTGRMADESEKLAAYQLGAVDYIQKPVDREELVARIRVMLRLEDARSRLDRENAALRSQLVKVEQALGDAVAQLADLQRLREAMMAPRHADSLVVGPDGRLRAVGEAFAALGEGFVVGERLADGGPSARRLARLDPASSDVVHLVLERDGVERHYRAAAHALPDGGMVVGMSDVSDVRAIEESLRRRDLADLSALAPKAGSTIYRMTDFVGSAPAVATLTNHVDRLRQTRSTVLVYGESGTGKELVARALHFDGKNRSAPFIPLHCGAIAQELIESELFGHAKGAFTGAQQEHEGLFRAADGGTIFLDEIAETSPSVQVKLLRVLQRGEIRPVGSNQSRIVDVRIIAATNRDLLELVREGRFREDLYYRIGVVTLHLPPLRERLEDLPSLVDSFLRKCNRRHDRLDRPVRGIANGALARLRDYTWPGNVRELENVVERAFALGVGDVLREEDLPAEVLQGKPLLGPNPVSRGILPLQQTDRSPRMSLPPPETDLRTRREAAEREAIAQALSRCRGDRVAAAQSLGMARSTFYRRVRELGL
jgi:two-component system, NtrC family, response regulator HydG